MTDEGQRQLKVLYFSVELLNSYYNLRTANGDASLGFPRGEAGMANNRHFGTDYLP